MLRVGLTGGIGTGKSYVRARMEARGLPTIDADRLARDAVRAGTQALSAIAHRFGAGVVTATGDLDRKALAAIVFADEDARHDLERIVHPAVYAAILEWFSTQASLGASIAVADIPLLYESGRADAFDAIVVAACDPAEQLRRVMRRDAASEAEARARMAAQWPIEEKTRRADYVVRTDGAFAETDRLVDEVIAELRARASERQAG